MASRWIQNVDGNMVQMKHGDNSRKQGKKLSSTFIHCNGRIIGKPVRTNARCRSKNNHVNLVLNNFVKATIFADMIVHIGTLDFINSNASKKSILKYCTNTPSAMALLLFIP
jgi:hypothetical protein